MPDDSPYAAHPHHHAEAPYETHAPYWSVPSAQPSPELPFRGTLSTPGGAWIGEASGMLRSADGNGRACRGQLLSLLDRRAIEQLCLTGERFRLELETGASLTIRFIRIAARDNLIFHAEFLSVEDMGDI